MSVRKEKGRSNSKDRTAETAGDFTSDGSHEAATRWRPTVLCLCTVHLCRSESLASDEIHRHFHFSCFVATYCGRVLGAGAGQGHHPAGNSRRYISSLLVLFINMLEIFSYTGCAFSISCPKNVESISNMSLMCSCWMMALIRQIQIT